jgi:hypothetical protein
LSARAAAQPAQAYRLGGQETRRRCCCRAASKATAAPGYPCGGQHRIAVPRHSCARLTRYGRGPRRMHPAVHPPLALRALAGAWPSVTGAYLATNALECLEQPRFTAD